jgi:hypothetical protein
MREPMFNLNGAQFAVNGNGSPGQLTFHVQNNIWSGTMLGDPLSNFVVGENFIKFRRKLGGPPGHYQDYSGSVMNLKEYWSTNATNSGDWIIMMGTFTQDDKGCNWWTTSPLQIP